MGGKEEKKGGILTKGRLQNKKNVKLGLLAEPLLAPPPPPLLTWALLSGNIVVFEHFKAVFKH